MGCRWVHDFQVVQIEFLRIDLFVGIDQVFAHPFLGVERFLTQRTKDRHGAVVNAQNVLFQVTPTPEQTVALLASKLFVQFLGLQLGKSLRVVQPPNVHLERGVRVDVFAANFATVRRNPEVLTQMLHEQTHVPEGLDAHAALELGNLVSGRRDVDVVVHFVLVLEQDVVDRTGHLAKVNQRMGLHILFPLEFHVALVAGHFFGAFSALFHVSFDRRTFLAHFPAFWTRNVFALRMHVPFGHRVVVFDVNSQVTTRTTGVVALGALVRLGVVVCLDVVPQMHCGTGDKPARLAHEAGPAQDGVGLASG